MSAFKTGNDPKPCRNFIASGTCSFGDTCRFSHSSTAAHTSERSGPDGRQNLDRLGGHSWRGGRGGFESGGRGGGDWSGASSTGPGFGVGAGAGRRADKEPGLDAHDHIDRGGRGGRGGGAGGRGGGVGAPVEGAPTVTSVWLLAPNKKLSSFRISPPDRDHNYFKIEPDFGKWTGQKPAGWDGKFMPIECDFGEYSRDVLAAENKLWKVLEPMIVRPGADPEVRADFRLGGPCLKREPNASIVLIGSHAELLLVSRSLDAFWRRIAGSAASATSVADDLALALVPVPLSIFNRPDSSRLIEVYMHSFLEKQVRPDDAAAAWPQFGSRLVNARDKFQAREVDLLGHHLKQMLSQSHQWARCFDGIAGVSPVTDDSVCALIMVQDDHTRCRDVWSDLPGGKRHVGECSLDAAKREFTEETSFPLDDTYKIIFGDLPDAAARQKDRRLDGTFLLYFAQRDPVGAALTGLEQMKLHT